MLNALVFKKKHALFLFFLLVALYVAYTSVNISPLEQKIIFKERVNNKANILITEASAGATTDFSYRFYILDSDKSTEKINKMLDNNYSPFLITSDPKALIKIESGIVYLDVKGKIFLFNNNPAYHYNDSIFTIPIIMNARPY